MTLSHLKNKFSNYDKMKSFPVFLRKWRKLCCYYFFKEKEPNWSQKYSIRSFQTEQPTEEFYTLRLSPGAKCSGSGARRSMHWQAGNHYCALGAKAAPPVFPHPHWNLLQTSLPFPAPALAVPPLRLDSHRYLTALRTKGERADKDI